MHELAVWVTRPEPGASKTAAVLRAAGHEVIAAPVLEVVTVPPTPAPTMPWPDWVILVSANAARGLAAANLGVPTTHFAAVGQATARAARDLGWEVELVPEQEHAEGLIAACEARGMAGKRVWIPAGDRQGSARVALPQALGQMGASVEVLGVYETRNRPLASSELTALASTRRPGAVVVHSPSAAEAVYSGPCPDFLARWRKKAVAVAVGPVTRQRLEDLGMTQIEEAHEPSDSGVLLALTAVARRTT